MPGFNGQIYNIKLLVGNAYIADQASFLAITGLIPSFDINSLIQFNQVNQSQVILVGQGFESDTQIGGGEDAFPREYSVSGWLQYYSWFKWTGPYTAEQHLIFRLTINDQNYNKDKTVLGDRTLAVFARQDQSFRCSTYTYQNMKAEGDPDYSQDVQHHGKIEEWHFLYFGYSKNQTRAYFFYQSIDSQDSQDFIRINHYLVDHFYFLLIDSRYPNYNGLEAMININLGPGAFLKSSSNYQSINDVFQYSLGLSTFLNIVTANSTNSSKIISIV